MNLTVSCVIGYCVNLEMHTLTLSTMTMTTMTAKSIIIHSLARGSVGNHNGSGGEGRPRMNLIADQAD
jgi:hypothetical protein